MKNRAQNNVVERTGLLYFHCLLRKRTGVLLALALVLFSFHNIVDSIITVVPSSLATGIVSRVGVRGGYLALTQVWAFLVYDIKSLIANRKIIYLVVSGPYSFCFLTVRDTFPANSSVALTGDGELEIIINPKPSSSSTASIRPRFTYQGL